MRGFDFSSWQGVISTVLGIALFALIGVGIRIVMMLTIQQRQQRLNRQINERLRVMIAAYKTLGGSFTGDLMVDPRHMRELRPQAAGTVEVVAAAVVEAGGEAGGAGLASPLQPVSPATGGESEGFRFERMRQTRDAVEAALSDIILLGTEAQVRLAARAATDMAEGRQIRTAELVVSLRDSIREALDLEPVPKDVVIPQQGPTRPQAGRSGSSGRSGGGGERQGGGGSGSGGAGSGGAGGGGGGMGMGMGLGMGRRGDDA